ncbi:retrovirus-related pol polyprotein from transposon TNT 1-94 [Tanacetum coccineum]|uniref:Retrovirus-related pol polyprotein from transposon TNT 1-94 n=1 Tax=Tanacetum coccineum TaxID=301880 RepID=A0ABQ4YDL1_9ASTR
MDLCMLRLLTNRNPLGHPITVNVCVIAVRFGNDEYAAIIGYGDYKLGDTIISRVYYVEGLKHNLFSVGQFCDGGLEVAFRQHSCHIRNYDMVDLLKGSRTTNLYSISLNDMMSASPVCLLTKASSTKSWLWHRRLNHLNFGTLNELARKNLVRGLPMLKYDKDHLCPSCQLGKSKKASHPLKTENTNTEVLHTLHMDLCGPMRTESINGKKYVLVIVDDYTRFGWNDFFRSKDETPQNNGDGVFKKPLLACYTLNLILVHDASRKDYNERLKGKKPKSTILPSVWISCYPTNDLYDDICKHKTKSRIDPEPPSVPPTKKQVDDLFQWFDDDEVCTDDPPGLCPITPVNVPDAPAPENANGSPSTTVISEGAPAVTESLLPHQVPLPDTSDSDVETLFDHVDSNVFDTYNAPETYCLEASSSKLYRSDKTLHCSRGGSRSMNMVNFPDGRENRLPQRWSSKKQKSSSHRFHYEAEYIALSRMLCSNPLDAVLNYDTMAFVQQQIRRFGIKKPVTSSDALSFDSLFVIGKLNEQIQSRDNTIHELKEKISRLTKKYSDADPIFEKHQICCYYSVLDQELNLNTSNLSASTKDLLVKLDEYGDVLKNKARLVAKGYRQEEEFDLHKSYPVDTPMVERTKLHEDLSGIPVDQTQYRIIMADANINAPEAPVAADFPPTRSDEQILPRDKWVPVGKSNCFLDVERTQANPIFKIVVDILKNTNFFRSFTTSSTIPSIYIQQFWDTIRFDKDKGYSCQLDEQRFYLTKATLRDALQLPSDNSNFTPPPNSNTIISFVNNLGYPNVVRTLSGVVTNTLQPWRHSQLSSTFASRERPQDLKDRELQYCRSCGVGQDESGSSCGAEEINLVEDKPTEAPSARIAKRSKAGKVLKKRTLSNTPQLVDEFVDEGVPDKELMHGDEEADTQRAIEESLKEAQGAHREVEGKGKEKVGEEQAAQVLLNLQTPKKKNPVEQFIFQRRTPATTEPSGLVESSSLYAELGLTDSGTDSDEEVSPDMNAQCQEEGQGGTNPGDAGVSQTPSSHVVYA